MSQALQRPPTNGSHNVQLTQPGTAEGHPEYLVRLRELADRHSLAWWAAQYLATEVFGIQAPNTLDAKARDLEAFIRWFLSANGHGNIDGWMARDTRAFLNQLERDGKAPTTINRVYATLRRFARWAHEQPGGVFAQTGLPTAGIKPLVVDEPPAKKLDKREVYQVFKAADALALTETRANARPRRNRAILSVLYYTGLRVSELVGLRRNQYDGKYLTNVKRKGRARTKGIYVPTEARRALDEYLETERRRDDPKEKAEALFVSSGRADKDGGYLDRRSVGLLLDHLAQEASKHRDAKLEIWPHRLRHSFGSEYRAKTGSDTETAVALGHTGLKYVARYVRKTDEEREAVLEQIKAGE